ncbi:MAG: hypothetical protein ABSB01_11920 [Streptosporangiaceae bacterium]
MTVVDPARERAGSAPPVFQVVPHDNVARRPAGTPARARPHPARIKDDQR